MLCDACYTALTTDVDSRVAWDDRGGQFVHHHTPEDFRRAVQDKCHICLSLWHNWELEFGLPRWLPGLKRLSQGNDPGSIGLGVRHFSMFHLRRRAESSNFFEWRPISERSFLISFELGYGYNLLIRPHDTNQIPVTFAVNPYRDVQHLLPRSSISKSTGDDASFSLVRSWLDDCTNNHPICNESRAAMGSFLGRILDISRANDHGVIVLVDATSTPSNGPYATLSHCWGATSHLKLLKDNMLEFRRGIPLSTLPSVYREAIDIALRLGVSNLWIDSLCIIQDDTDDWLREAGRMFEIYRHASFNIGATGAADGDGRCFVDHDLDLLGPCLFDYDRGSVADKEAAGPGDKETETEHSMPIHPDSTWHVVEETYWANRLYQQPLIRRAWVLQERLISPRMIHFGQDQIYWECHQLHACETYPWGPAALYSLQAHKTVRTATIRDVYMKMIEVGPDRRTMIDPNPLLPTVDTPDNELALWAWADIVQKYNDLDLTVPRDKFVALSGLAKLMQGLVQDEYVAGLWKSCMITGLLWKIPQPKQQRTAHTLSGSSIPTWSWASVHGELPMLLVPDAKLKKLGVDVYITIRDVIIDPPGGDEYAGLSRAILRVECRLWPAAFLLEDMRQHYKNHYSIGDSHSTRLYLPFVDIGGGDQWEYDGFACTADTPIQVGDLGPEANLHVMPVMCRMIGGTVNTQGLILRQFQSEEGTIQCRRVGHFEYWTDQSFPDAVRNVIGSPIMIIEII